MAAILKNFKRDTLYLCNRLTDFNEIDRMVIHLSLIHISEPTRPY